MAPMQIEQTVIVISCDMLQVIGERTIEDILLQCVFGSNPDLFLKVISRSDCVDPQWIFGEILGRNELLAKRIDSDKNVVLIRRFEHGDKFAQREYNRVRNRIDVLQERVQDVGGFWHVN